MDQAKLTIGDIVQINPNHDPDEFGGALMIVTGLDSTGAQGIVTSPKMNVTSRVSYKCEYKHLVLVGRAMWLFEEDK